MSGILPRIVLLASDAANVVNLFTGPQWGLFTAAGAPAFSPLPGGIIAQVLTTLASGFGQGQSISKLGYRVDHRVTTAPQEQGAFMSYNKVSTPFQGRVTYMISGNVGLRHAFIQQLQALQASLTLLSLVMPDYTFPSCTIVHHDFDRSAHSGVSMYPVEIGVEEIRVTGTTQFTQTASPSGANQVNGGTVQTLPASQTPGATPAGGFT